jgi:hypothetical protein
LAKDPERRFPSCTAFVHALLDAEPGPADSAASVSGEPAPAVAEVPERLAASERRGSSPPSEPPGLSRRLAEGCTLPQTAPAAPAPELVPVAAEPAAGAGCPSEALDREPGPAPAGAGAAILSWAVPQAAGAASAEPPCRLTPVRSPAGGGRDTVWASILQPPAVPPRPAMPENGAWFSRLEGGSAESWGLLAASNRIAADVATDPEARRAAVAALFASEL